MKLLSLPPLPPSSPLLPRLPRLREALLCHFIHPCMLFFPPRRFFFFHFSLFFFLLLYFVFFPLLPSPHTSRQRCWFFRLFWIFFGGAAGGGPRMSPRILVTLFPSTFPSAESALQRTGPQANFFSWGFPKSSRPPSEVAEQSPGVLGGYVFPPPPLLPPPREIPDFRVPRFSRASAGFVFFLLTVHTRFRHTSVLQSGLFWFASQFLIGVQARPPHASRAGPEVWDES